jgi:hypothetical protein
MMPILATATWLYVEEVLDRQLAGENNLASLHADRWAAAHPESIRPHRVEEARYRADAKATCSARRRLADQSLTANSSRPSLINRPENKPPAVYISGVRLRLNRELAKPEKTNP